jgi:hypothetical protein
MRFICKRRTILPILMLLLVMALVLATASGCSKKAKADDGSASKDSAADASAVAGDEDQGNFQAVNEGILKSMQELYSERGINISAVELETSTRDSARITLEYPEHSTQQAVLAGLKILKDNFPRTHDLVVVVAGRKYHCGLTELAYIISKGYTFETTEEEAQLYMDIVNNGIPPEDAEKPIEREKI